MKKNIIICCCLLGLSFAKAQDIISVDKKLFKINLLLPGIVYEHGLDAKNTIYSELSTGIGFRKNSFGSTWTFYPVINEQLRHYYNLEKRSLKGKKITENSGNFLALNAIYNFKSFSTQNNSLNNDDASFVIAPVWGMQRTYTKKLNLSLNAGLGYVFHSDQTYKSNGIVPVFNFSIGWVIGK
jgi:hypothetical protein